MAGTILPGAALKAYQSTKSIPVAKNPVGLEAGQQRVGPSFGDYIETGAKEAVKTVKHAEEMQLKGISGKESHQKVVEAVLAAEMTVQTVVAVRDRMVSAYQEIMRMPV